MKISFPLENLENIAIQVLSSYPKNRVFLLKGNLGAGKTTFVQGLVKVLGLGAEVSSPTYTLVQDYSEKGLKVYHLDLYRAQSISEILDMGFWEYIDQAHYIFIEWPEMIEPLLDLSYITLELERESQSKRILSVKESISIVE